MTSRPPSLNMQALAVWYVDTRPYRTTLFEGFTFQEFCDAIAEARVTLNAIAASPDLARQVEAAVNASRRAHTAALDKSHADAKGRRYGGA